MFCLYKLPKIEVYVFARSPKGTTKPARPAGGQSRNSKKWDCPDLRDPVQRDFSKKRLAMTYAATTGRGIVFSKVLIIKKENS